MLAGAAVEGLKRPPRWPLAIIVAVAPVAGLVAANRELAAHHRRIAETTTVAIVLVGALLGIALAGVRWDAMRRLSPMARLVPILLLLLVAWDSTGRELAGSLRTTRPAPAVHAALIANAAGSDPGGAGEFLQERLRTEGPFRFFGYDPGLLTDSHGETRTYRELYRRPLVQSLLVNARAMRFGLYDVQGYDPVQLGRYVEFLRALNGGVEQDYHDANVLPPGVSSPLLDLLNVRYVVIPNGPPSDQSGPDFAYLTRTSTEVYRNDRVRVLERASALPRAWIVHDAVEVPRGQALKLLAAGVDPRQVAIVERPAPALRTPSNASPDAVTTVQVEGDEIRLRARTDADGMLVLSETYAPGWAAYVDGKRVPVYVTDHVLRGVPLTAGDHVVELRYEPDSLRIGLLVTFAAVVVLVILLVAAARYHVRRTPSRSAEIGPPAGERRV
jgi:hypothetical protein